MDGRLEHQKKVHALAPSVHVAQKHHFNHWFHKSLIKINNVIFSDCKLSKATHMHKPKVNKEYMIPKVLGKKQYTMNYKHKIKTILVWTVILRSHERKNT